MKPLLVLEEPISIKDGRVASNSSWMSYACDIVSRLGGGCIWVPLDRKGICGGRNSFAIPPGVEVQGAFYYRSFLDYYKKLPFNYLSLYRGLSDAVKKCDFVLVRAPSQIASPLMRVCKIHQKPIVTMYAGDFLLAASPLQNRSVYSSILRVAALIIDKAQRKLGAQSIGVVSIGDAVAKRYKVKCPVLVMSDSTVPRDAVELGLRRDIHRATPLRLVRVASYLKNKNYELLFDVIRKLRVEGWKGSLECYGPIPDQDYFNTLREMAPEDVHLHGPLEAGGAVLEMMRSKDVQIICSRSEGIPRTILEGASSGVALISLDIGGISSIVTHDQNAILVPDNGDNENAQRLALAVLDVEHNQELFSRLVSDGLRLSETMTREHSIEMLSVFLNGLFNNE